MLHPNLLGKGRVLRIRTRVHPTPVLASLQTLQREASCLPLRAWSRVTPLALEIFQRSPGDHLARTRQKKILVNMLKRGYSWSHSACRFCNS